MTPRLHMIGNAHLDPVWLWRWPEGCAEAIGTVRPQPHRALSCPGSGWQHEDRAIGHPV